MLHCRTMVRIADLICGERMARGLEPCRAASVPGTAPSAQLTGRRRTIQTNRFRQRCRPQIRAAFRTSIGGVEIGRNIASDGPHRESLSGPPKPVSRAGPAARGRRCKRRGHGALRHGADSPVHRPDVPGRFTRPPMRSPRSPSAACHRPGSSPGRGLSRASARAAP